MVSVNRLQLIPTVASDCAGGAVGEELDRCRQKSGKMLWQKIWQFRRHHIERRYEDRMDFTVQEPASLRPGDGVAEAPDIGAVG